MFMIDAQSDCFDFIMSVMLLQQNSRFVSSHTVCYPCDVDTGS